MSVLLLPFSGSALDVLLVLIMAHWVGDFGLQSDRMAVEKVPGCDATLPWYWWLLGHAATHGLLVALIIGSAWLGVLELIAHAVIDWCKGRFGFRLALDQMLHVLCKFIWVMMLSMDGLLR